MLLEKKKTDVTTTFNLSSSIEQRSKTVLPHLKVQQERDDKEEKFPSDDDGDEDDDLDADLDF